MNKKLEIIWGIIMGILAAIMISLFIFADSLSAELPEDNGELDVSISADTVSIDLDKDGLRRSITIDRNEFSRSPEGITVNNEILIENGKIIVDGVELTEDELEKLSVDMEEDDSDLGFNFGERKRPIIKHRRLATIYADTDVDVFKFGDIDIEKDRRVRGDVVSMRGEITVEGEVGGDVVAVFGDITLERGARVEGDAVAPFGRISRGEDVYVGGDRVSEKRFERHKHSASFGMGGRFDRVEGLTLTPSLRYESLRGEYPTLNLEGAYAFTLKRWEYNFRIDHRLGRDFGPLFSGSIYQTVNSSDTWLIPWQEENTVAALFFKEDFLDYYWMRGFTGATGLWYGKHFDLTARYTGAKIETLEKTAEKALFGGKKEFRENWSTVLPDSSAILGMEGNLKEIGLGVTYDTRDDKYDASRGMLAHLSFQKTVDSDSADFDYRTVDAEFKWYHPMTHDQTFFLRLRGGFSDDDLPLFRRYFIGGLGSLRGYDYKEFEGNRYMLLNLDYIWSFYKSDLGAGLFIDMGKAGFGKSEFDSMDMKTSAGLAFIVSDAFRINLAQRLDDTGRSPVFSVRGKILF